METLFSYGLQGVLAFGAVGIISLVADRLKHPISTETKIVALVVVAFLVGFVPADLGDQLLNRIKDAVTIGLGVHAIWTGFKQIAK